MENFIITVTFLLLGLLLKRVSLFPKESAQVLNLFVIYISLPALILLRVPDLAFSSDLVIPAVMPWLMLLVSALLVLLLAKIFTWSRSITGAMLLMVPLGNTSFLGIPMVKAFLGETAISYAVIYDQLGSFLALATFGSVVLAFYSQGSQPTAKEIIKRIATFPPFLALLIALLTRNVAHPVILTNLLNSLAATLVPVVMIAVGYQLSFRLTREDIRPLSLGLGVKLIAAPLCALLFCRLFGLDSLAAKVAVFEAGMPPMVSAGAMAIIADLSPKLTAAMIGIGILVSFLTLPLLYQLL